MNAVEAICCAGCGRELGLSPVGASGQSKCPRCEFRLTALSGEHGALLDCENCGGQFVEHALLRDLLEHREKLGRLALRQPLRQKLELKDVRYFGCPECGALMNRKNFGGSSGIVVDVCHRHGTWFDAAELAGVLAFVESGGPAIPPNSVQKADFRPTAGLGGLTKAESTLVGGVEVAADGLGVAEVVLDVGGELLTFVVGLISD